MAETIGWLCDKLSIIELKLYHMREQAERADVADEFRTLCRNRVEVMIEQRDDLAVELTNLLGDIASGAVVPKVYRQFKMYNDPQYRRPAAPPAPAS